MGRPEPAALRIRGSRIDPAALRQALETRGFTLVPVSGLDGFFRVHDGPYPVSRTLEHWLGHFYLQQAVTGVASRALGPRPGERVLDLCAAPGGKTTHLAELMAGEGTLVASDRAEKRIRGLLGNLYRMGHASVMVLSCDGERFPEGVLFDRVLADAPCSAEGNARRRARPLRAPSASFRAHISGVQERLLRRAIRLVKPGGTVLYVTCTYAPEENEAVVSRVLEDGQVSMVPIDLDLPHASGLTRFEDQRFDAALELAWRLYPHHFDSGGLFMARLRRHEAPGPSRSATPTGASWGTPPAVFRDDGVGGGHERGRLEETLTTLKHDWGVNPLRLESMRWLIRGESVWMHTCADWPLDAWAETAGDAKQHWRLVCVGIRAMGPGPGGRLRPTNDFLRWLDYDVGARVADLTPELLIDLLEGRAPDATQLPGGFVALRLDGRVIGRGQVRRGGLFHEIPKAMARSLREVLDPSRTGTP